MSRITLIDIPRELQATALEQADTWLSEPIGSEVAIHDTDMLWNANWALWLKRTKLGVTIWDLGRM